jgi:hypothetical protein
MKHMQFILLIKILLAILYYLAFPHSETTLYWESARDDFEHYKDFVGYDDK